MTCFYYRAALICCAFLTLLISCNSSSKADKIIKITCNIPAPQIPVNLSELNDSLLVFRCASQKKISVLNKAKKTIVTKKAFEIVNSDDYEDILKENIIPYPFTYDTIINTPDLSKRLYLSKLTTFKNHIYTVLRIPFDEIINDYFFEGKKVKATIVSSLPVLLKLSKNLEVLNHYPLKNLSTYRKDSISVLCDNFEILNDTIMMATIFHMDIDQYHSEKVPGFIFYDFKKNEKVNFISNPDFEKAVFSRNNLNKKNSRLKPQYVNNYKEFILEYKLYSVDAFEDTINVVLDLEKYCNNKKRITNINKSENGFYLLQKNLSSKSLNLLFSDKKLEAITLLKSFKLSEIKGEKLINNHFYGFQNIKQNSFEFIDIDLLEL
jgi:hypothetical protein